MSSSVILIFLKHPLVILYNIISSVMVNVISDKSYEFWRSTLVNFTGSEEKFARGIDKIILKRHIPIFAWKFI